MTHKNIANKWGISVKTFYRWKKRGHIPDTILTHDIESVGAFLKEGGDIKQYKWAQTENDTQGHTDDTEGTEERHQDDTQDDTQEDSRGQGSAENGDFIDFLKSQIDTKDRQIDTLHERIREQNVLLRDSQLLLKAAEEQRSENEEANIETEQPIQSPPEQPIQPQPAQTGQGRGEWRTALISLGIVVLLAVTVFAVWFFVIQGQSA